MSESTRAAPRAPAPPVSPADAEARQVRVGHVWIDAVSFEQTLERIAALVAARTGGSVFTPNVDHVVIAEDDLAFRSAYAGTSLSVADGKPLVWATRWLGTPVPEKVSGSDLVWPLLQRAAAGGWGVYVLGGAPGSAETAARRMERELAVRVVGLDAPRIEVAGGPGEEEVVERIRSARPDIILVGLGSPKQERFIARVLPRVRPAIALGVGASIDFLAGRARRAPRWISAAGLEWLFRLLHEPRRLARRYLVRDPRFVLVFGRTARMPRSERVRIAGTAGPPAG